ncbi:glutamine ABC transporter ATP-binding protein, partial [Staphylococcus simulans]
MTLLELNSVRKSFNSKVVLKDISLSINEKDIVAIIGSNGAG